MSRTLVFPKTCGTLVDTNFDQLCRQPLGAVDYLAIAKEFDVVFIRGKFVTFYCLTVTMKNKSNNKNKQTQKKMTNSRYQQT